MPILHNVEQRSEAWDKLRLGIPTASCFHRIVTQTGRPSEQWHGYAYHLIAERLLGRQVDTYTSPAMERGATVEAEAVDWYELNQDLDTQEIGFITTDDGRIGCSPDRLIAKAGLLEIKCPQPATQVQYLLTGKLDKKYWPQIQGQLYVSERVWVDVLAWHDELPSTVIRVERDEKFIAKLDHELAMFNAEIDRVMDMIREVHGLGDRIHEHREPSERLRAALLKSLEAER